MGYSTFTFRKNILDNTLYDYGDFMRSANVSLLLLREELRPLQDHFINDRIDLMQTYIQFSPSWNVQATCRKLLRDDQYLDELLMGHQQDWESGSANSYFKAAQDARLRTSKVLS